jgi:hypothetical protein
VTFRTAPVRAALGAVMLCLLMTSSMDIDYNDQRRLGNSSATR